MIQTPITEPTTVIIREIRIQEVLYNNEITYAVINESKINKEEAYEMLYIANLIIQQFKDQ